VNSKILGGQGENCAAAYLRKKGYRILEQNYSTHSGEIDIIAENGETLVFVEVKTRSSLRYGTPAEAVNFRKRNKIIQTASWYLRQRHMEHRPCRFDVIEIYATGGLWTVRQIEGAFEL
jgi:TIGR00252 family protein